MQTTRSARRGREGSRLSAVEVGILAVALAALVAVAIVSGRTPGGGYETTTIRVTDSDTLWGIAKTHPLPDTGTAGTVAAIRRINGMTGSDLYAGQILRVPDAEPSGSLAMR